VDELAGATEELNEKATLLQVMTEKFTLGDQGSMQVEELSFKKSIRGQRKERRGTEPPTIKPLRDELATQHPIEDKSEDFIEKELDEGFEEF
jgi:hypothetical protein